jgi:hypothetical protein
MDAKDREVGEKELTAEPLGDRSGDAARHLAYLTGMSADAAATYAAFHSGRWAQGPAGRLAA